MPLRFEVQEGVALVTLDRREAMNALDPSLRIELHEAWQRIRGDGAIRCVVLTGAGERAFCAGADLKRPVPEGVTLAPLAEGMDMDTPIVCAINGDAFGGGLELALACDIRLSSRLARFGLPEVQLGTLAGGGGTQRLPRLVGGSDAMRILLTGERLDAVEAHRIGLVSELFEPADLMPAALRMARRIAQNAPLSVRATKRLVRDGIDIPLEQALQAEREAFIALRDTQDRQEGRQAFLEKRTPVFKGR